MFTGRCVTLRPLEIRNVPRQCVVDDLPFEDRGPCLLVLFLVDELEGDGVELGADVGFAALWVGGWVGDDE